MNIKYTLNQELSLQISSAIEEYDGGEIFFGCILDDEGEITDAHPVCYGSDDAVLAPYEIVEKYRAILHNHPSGDVKPSSQDMNYANYLQQSGIGFFITNNECTKLNTVVPPVLVKAQTKLDKIDIYTCFSPGGKISSLKEDYEYREGQQKMACLVTDALNENKIAIIEAGTGIGKSLAYSIPAFSWAQKNNERIVISTNTINLQSQLLHKDIPFVKQILNSKLKAVVVKGRRNYVCKLKMYNLNNELEFDEEAEELNSILKWANMTKSGDIDDINFVPAYSTWEKVASDADFCAGRNCIFYQRCFFQMARREATEASILIVNHHILFADVDIRSKGKGLDENLLLPPYRKIIFDEAHNIVKSASSFFSYSFSKSNFYKFIGYLRKKKTRGFFPGLLRQLKGSKNDDVKKIVTYIEEEVFESLSTLHVSATEIFDGILRYLDTIIEEKGSYYNKVNIQYRIRKEEWESDEFNEIFLDNLKDLALHLGNFEKCFDILAFKFENLPKSLKEKYDIEIKLLKSYQNKLLSMQENINSLTCIEGDEYVTWLEIFGESDDPLFRLNASPLYINRILCKHLYDVFDSVIFSSATISVNKTFDYFKSTSGLTLCDSKEIVEESFDSPFDYARNVLFTAPIDIPEPRDAEYNDRLNDFLKHSIVVTEGSSFVLFTSYNQLKKSFDEVGPYLEDKGLRCLYQGEMEKNKLLEQFKTDIPSSLFATSSFWEGVDAPGETLKFVVLAKLPFHIPTEPIEEARVEDMEKRGINSFMSYTLPTAIIKFKQGFGRLIRKKDDYGIVAVLDSRVLRKQYGKLFFRSLPRCKFQSGTLDMILDAMKKHMEECESR